MLKRLSILAAICAVVMLFVVLFISADGGYYDDLHEWTVPTSTSTPDWRDGIDWERQNSVLPGVQYQGHSTDGEWEGCARDADGQWVRIDDLPCEPLDRKRKEREDNRVWITQTAITNKHGVSINEHTPTDRSADRHATPPLYRL